MTGPKFLKLLFSHLAHWNDDHDKFSLGGIFCELFQHFTHFQGYLANQDYEFLKRDKMFLKMFILHSWHKNEAVEPKFVWGQIMLNLFSILVTYGGGLLKAFWPIRNFLKWYFLTQRKQIYSFQVNIGGVKLCWTCSANLNKGFLKIFFPIKSFLKCSCYIPDIKTKL